MKIFNATYKVLKKRSYFLLFLLFSLLFFGILFLTPVLAVPGNTIALQLTVFTFGNYILMIFLSLLIGVNFSLMIYSMKNKKKNCCIQKSALSGASTGISGVFAVLIGTAACSSCLIPLFALFGIGLGGAIFILNYQVYFVSGAIAIMLLSLYFTARKI